MKKILFICPYFGKLPINHMKLWLLSCEKNPTIDWLILTDDHADELKYPSNVKVVYTTLEEIKQQAQKKFDFSIYLGHPYKLCDYKPAYGYIFTEYTHGYDYWGHCDMTDCIFGNLRKFLSDDFLSGADKFMFLGHMTLYRNTDEINSRIFEDVSFRKNNLEKIFGSERNWAFDELNPTSINTIYLEHGWQIKRFDEMYADMNALEKNFVTSEYDSNFRYKGISEGKHIFEWNSGTLTDWTLHKDGFLTAKELGYAHFQKRYMENKVTNPDKFCIVPNAYVDAPQEIDTFFVRKHTSYCRYMYPQYYKLRYKNLKFKIKNNIESFFA